MRVVLHHSALLHLARSDARIDESYELLAPSSSRSHVLSLLHEQVHRGELDAGVAQEHLAYVRRLRMRLLGDAVMQRVAWEVADQLDWPTTYDAEYIALTILQGDALITTDEPLSATARSVVAVGSIDTITR